MNVVLPRGGEGQDMAPTSSPGQRELRQPMLLCQRAGLEGRTKEQVQKKSQTSAGIWLFPSTLPWYAVAQLPCLFFVKYKTGSCLFIS